MNETHAIEWKQSWRDEYLKWICAFANTEGGVLIIGKDDDGNTVPIKNYQRLLEDIPSKIKNYLGIICAVNLRHDSGPFIEIVVNAYANPISYRGKYYVRSGSTTHELNGVELSDFLLLKAGKTWDEVPVEDATIDDIDPSSVQTFIEDGTNAKRLPKTKGLSNSEILEKLRLSYNGQIKRAGILLFGKDPNHFFPNCKVMIGRFGSDSEDLKFQESLEGNVVYLLHEVQEMLNYKFLIKPLDFSGMIRKENDEYPVAALREMLLNALVHKKYGGAAIQIRVFDDKMSIWNEGTLPAGFTVESLKREHNSNPPNKILADACFKAGYIDTWGRGTLKIYKACEEAGLPEPEIAIKDGGIEVTLFKVAASEKLRRNFEAISEELTDKPKRNYGLLETNFDDFITFLASKRSGNEEELRKNFGETSDIFSEKFGNKGLLLFIVALNPSISAKDAAPKVGVSPRTIETYFSELKKEGIIERIGSDRSGKWNIKL
ncbi:MAG: ATP-binding protein [Gracilimonas sp.]|nr:ATP-binding protein [Gracilimonas sp.]